MWGEQLQKAISRSHRYILLTSAQLVGVCLYIFVRPYHVPFVRWEHFVYRQMGEPRVVLFRLPPTPHFLQQESGPAIILVKYNTSPGKNQAE